MAIVLLSRVGNKLTELAWTDAAREASAASRKAKESTAVADTHNTPAAHNDAMLNHRAAQGAMLVAMHEHGNAHPEGDDVAKSAYMKESMHHDTSAKYHQGMIAPIGSNENEPWVKQHSQTLRTTTTTKCGVRRALANHHAGYVNKGMPDIEDVLKSANQSAPAKGVEGGNRYHYFPDTGGKSKTSFQDLMNHQSKLRDRGILPGRMSAKPGAPMNNAMKRGYKS